MKPPPASSSVNTPAGHLWAYGHAPFGRWKTQTFIAAPRSHKPDAPWIVGTSSMSGFKPSCPCIAQRRNRDPGQCDSTKAPGPSKAYANKEPGSCSCRLVPQILTPLKWRSRKSRHTSQRPPPEPMMLSGNPPDKYENCSQPKNAETDSKKPDMKAITHETL